MKKYYLLGVMVLIFVGFAFSNFGIMQTFFNTKTVYLEGNTDKIIRTNNYTGAIITIDGEENWLPDKKVIDEFETRLVPYLQNFKGNEYVSSKSEAEFVLKNIKKYKRQYIGRFDNRRKILYVNCMLVSDNDTTMNWQNRYIEINDGGHFYFQIKYDIEKKELYGFQINGYA